MAVDISDPPVRVLVTDAQTIVRDGLRLLIEADGLTVVGETGCASRLVELCERTRPDVVLLDPKLPDLSAAAVVPAIGARCPGVRVLALAASVDRQLAGDLLAAGACGYLLKTIDRRGLVAAIRAAAEGRCSLDPVTAAQLAGPPPTRAADTAGLTRRERDVLSLVASGRTNKVIAKELAISDGTVRVYLSEILGKLGAANRTEAAMIALKRGLVELPE